MRLKITTVAVLLAALAGPAAAQQITNLRVAPDPVPYPFFDGTQAKESTALSLAYVGTSMKLDNSPNLDLNGLDMGVGYRQAIDDKMAWDAHFSLIPLFGRASNGTRMYSVGVPLSTDFEYQAFRNQTLGVILFGGLNFGIASANYAQSANYGATTTVPTGEGVNTTGSTSYLYGLQFGAQAGVNVGSVKLVPFLMISPDWGNYTEKYYDQTQKNIVSQSKSLPTMLLTSFGGQAWLANGWGLRLAYQTSPSQTQSGTKYAAYSSFIVGVNHAF